MIPTHDMLIDLWQKVAEGSPLDEPHVIVVPGADGIYTAAFLDTDDHTPYMLAAEHLYESNEIADPTWLAAMSPCHYLTTDNPNELASGDAAAAFASGDPRAHESIAVSIVTMDSPTNTVFYDQPFLDASTDTLDDIGGQMSDLLTWLLAKMNSPDD